MNRANDYAIYKLKLVFKHPYAWTILIVANLFIIYSLIGFRETMLMSDLDLPGPVLMMYIIGSWNILTYGVYVLFVLFCIPYYHNPHLDYHMMIRLGGRKNLFFGKSLSLIYLSLSFAISVLTLPALVALILGNRSESGWGSDVYTLSASDQISNVHPVIDALSENTSYISSFTPLNGLLIHFILIIWSLLILALLLDISQKVLRSYIWGSLIVLGYAFLYSFLIVSRTGANVTLFTLQAHTLLLPKVRGEVGGNIPYETSLLVLVTFSIFLIGCSYWKERYSNL